MIIILEGSDCAGKTTLMGELVREYTNRSGHYAVGTYHFGNYPHVTDYPRLYAEAMMPALSFNNTISIMDRSWISETPYAIAYRNGIDRFNMTHRRMLERMAVSSLRSVVILCDPGFDVIRDRFIERVDEEYLDNEDQLKDVHSWYRDFTRNSTELPVLDYDYRRDTAKDLVRLIENMPMNTMSYSKARSQFRPGFIGSGAAKVIVIGQQPEVLFPEDLHTMLPFVSFNRNSAGYKLTSWLGVKQVNEQDVAWIFPKDLDTNNIRVVYGKTVILVGEEGAAAFEAVNEAYVKSTFQRADFLKSTRIISVSYSATIEDVADAIEEGLNV